MRLRVGMWSRIAIRARPLVKRAPQFPILDEPVAIKPLSDLFVGEAAKAVAPISTLVTGMMLSLPALRAWECHPVCPLTQRFVKRGHLTDVFVQSGDSKQHVTIVPPGFFRGCKVDRRESLFNRRITLIGRQDAFASRDQLLIPQRP